MYFKYGTKEIEYLKNKDRIFGEAIEKIGKIEREVDTGLFFSVIYHIIGQQISTVAQVTIWKRMNEALGTVTAKTICDSEVETFQKLGMTFRKAEYIKYFADKVYRGRFDVEALNDMNDEEVIEELVKLKGIGVWTAEMIMIFCMQRPNVISYGDLAILRGLRMLYHHRKITPELFNKYKRRYSPYATVASLYLWAIAGGAISDMKDYAPLSEAEKKKRKKTKKKVGDLMNQDKMWEAVKNNDDSYDGIFFYAVKSTGIYCRPSCKSKLPKRENICFFDTSEEARKAGFRPCKRCRSDLLDYKPIKEMADKVKELLDLTYTEKFKLQQEMNNVGITFHRMNEIFKYEYGVTVSEYVSRLRLEEAKKRLINSNEQIIDIAYSIGFGSLSGFYRFFKENTGISPAKYRKEDIGNAK